MSRDSQSTRREGHDPQSNDANRFLRCVAGVIHIGANNGGERNLYESLGLDVLWIEPIPWVFEQLKANIAGLPRQRAIQALVTDEDGASYEFHVANNNGQSSSIFDLKHHKDIWPNVKYVETLPIKSKRLESLLREQNIAPSSYDALVMDTQGSELLVLKGAEGLLKQFRFVKTEAADFESYLGCCQLADIEEFLRRCGFLELCRHSFARRKGGGAYFDVVYERQS